MAYVNDKGLNKDGSKNIDSPSNSDLKVSAALDSMGQFCSSFNTQNTNNVRLVYTLTNIQKSQFPSFLPMPEHLEYLTGPHN